MLIIFALFCELVYLFLFVASRQLGILDLHNDQYMWLVVGSLLLLFIFYFVTYYFLDWKKLDIKAIFFVVCIFHIQFLFIPYLSSNDLYSYIFTTRLNGIFGENPYFVQYDSFPQDVLYPKLETIWAHHPTLYGPLFLHIGGVLNKIDQDNLSLLTYSFKSLFIGANLLSAFLIYKISRSKRAVFLFTTNPLVVFELSGNSHTESLTLLFLLASIYFLYRKPVAGFLGFVFSVLIKYYSAVFLPFYFIFLQKKGIKTLVLSLLIGGLLTIFIYWPFWQGFENFGYLMSYYNGEYTSPSLLIYLGQLLFGSYKLSFQINTFIFLSFAGVLMYKFWRSNAEIKLFLFYSFLLYFAYILTKSSLILPWYLIMLVALASLCSTWREYQKYALVGVIFVSIYSLGLYYFVR